MRIELPQIAEPTRGRRKRPRPAMADRPIKVRLQNYDWIVINSSAGKDSQTLLDVMVQRCLAEGIPLSRIVVVHADLGTMEWPGTRQLAEIQAQHYGVRFEVVERINKKGEQENLLDYVRSRHRTLQAKNKAAAAWPSNEVRWCTDKLKGGPANKLLTQLAKETPPWPSHQQRWCTSDLKRGPISTLSPS
jgi:3'-phosphoadenosine 5'-phosphosulfate sulfotransferase (PAPS reductase)/FAD synthetase